MNHFGLPITNLHSHFNSSSKLEIDNHIMKTQQELDQVMRIMRSNIEKLTERGDKLNELTLRTDALHQSTNQFGKTSHTIVRSYHGRPYFFYVSITLLILSLAVAIYYIYLSMSASPNPK